MPSLIPKKHYQVAFSFAGENRSYVEKVASILKRRGISVFYDEYEQVDLWGKNLYTHLNEIYKEQSDYTVIFISEYYSKKLWTNHERESAQARAFTENREYILPARFDDTEIPGFLPTTGYLDLRKLSPENFASFIEEKLKSSEALWKEQAYEAAIYSNDHHSDAHRGAILWYPKVTAVFANDGWGLEKEYVSDFKKTIDDLKYKILGESLTDDNYTWAILIDSPKVQELYDLIWESFARCATGDGVEIFVQVQKRIAHQRLYSYWNTPHKRK